MVENSTRREFIATSAAAGVLASLPTAGVFAAADETIKVGVIGCGGRGSGAAENILEADPKVKIVALGDVFENRVDSLYNRLKKKFADRSDLLTKEKVFVGFDAYRKVIDAGCDLVILATPPGFRPMHLEAAVKANKHIFTEKPVAVDAPGIRKCLEVYEEAKKKNLAIVAGTQRRHQAGYIATIKQIHDGAIGDVVAMRAYWNMGDIWFRNREKGMTDVAYQLHNWYHFVWLCGDHIVEQHVHNLDVINWIKGSTPVRCIGMGGRSNRRQGDPAEVGHIFDHFAVEYHYADGSVMQSYCRQIAGCDQNVSEAVVGTKGSSQVNAYSINGKKVFSGGETNPYVQEHIDLIASIRAGKPLNELKTVTESTMTAIMGRMSTYTGKPVTWKQAMESKEATMPENLAWDMELKTAPVPVVGKTKLI